MEVDEKEDNKQSIFNSGPDATSSLLASFGCLQTVDKTELIAEFQRLSSTSSEGTNPSSFHNTTNQESSQTGDHSNKSVEIIDEQTATFFLEMSRWNVSTALNAYFDCGGHKSCTSPSSLLPFLKLPEMCFVGDLTSESPFGTSTTTLMTCSVEELPDDSMTQRSITHSEVELGHEFLKVWRIRNSGSETWPPGIVLRPMHINDDPLVQAQYSCISNPSTGSIPLLNIPVKSLSPNEECDVEVRLKAPLIFETPKTFESPWRTSTSQGLMFGDTIWLILNVIVSSSSLQNQSEVLSSRTHIDSDSVTTTEAAFPSVPPSSPAAAVAATTTHHPLTLSSTVVSQFPTFSTSTTCEVLEPEVTQTSVCEEAKSVILTELRDHGGLEESDETTGNEMN